MLEAVDNAKLHSSVLARRRRLNQGYAREAVELAQWNTRRIWSDNGSRSAASRLSRETDISLAHARHLLHRAKRLQTMPLTLGKFLNGSISADKVDLLVMANQKNIADAFARDEQTLLDAIEPLRFSHALRATRYWIQMADEQSSEDKGQRQLQQRTASASRTFEGSVDLRAIFDPVNGEIFLNELERLEESLFKQDWAEAKALHGEDVTADHLARTATQRRCDALVLMATRSASTPAGSAAPRPLVTVVVDEKTFARTCELASGSVIAPGQIIPLLSQAQIERIVFDGPSRILDLGSKRLFVGALRRAVQIRDGFCTHGSGCDQPAEHCDIDHTLASVNGGKTNQYNGQALCAFHNRAKGTGPPKAA